MAFFALWNCAMADTGANPYDTIAIRNPFHLSDPPPPPKIDDLNKLPPPLAATVEVTGILNIFQKKQAFLEIIPSPGKPVVRRTLGEGERDDAIEVVSIDLEKNEVTINNAGVVTNVALKLASKSSAPNPVAPGLLIPPGVNSAYVQPPGSVYNPVPNGNTSASAAGRANVMVAGGSAPASPNAAPINPYGANQGYNPGANVPASTYNQGLNTSIGDLPRSIPPRTVRTQTTQPDGAPIDPAVQYINMAVQKQQAERAGKPFPPLPPIPGLEHQPQ
ncbi:MAG: hypothetical protein QOF48_635 [Verrucomicrobiota bacterium]